MLGGTVVQYTDSRDFGGSERVLLTLAARLAEGGVWNPIIAHHGGPGLRQLLDEAAACGIKTLELASEGGPFGLAVLRLARQLKALRPTVFHAHLTFPRSARRGLMAAAIARVPARLATVHLHEPVPPGWQRVKVRHWPVHRYLCVSEAVAAGLLESGVDESRIRVVLNGISFPDETTVPESSGPDEAGADGRGTIATVGRLVEQKAQHILLEALVGLPAASLMVIGDGPLRHDLERQAERLGIADRVRFMGQVRDVNTLLAQADVFALPSLNEGLPLAVLEAMALAKPVVATRVGGTPEIVVPGQTGLLVEPGDVLGFRDALARLMSDREFARQLGRRAQKLVRERYSAAAMVARVADIYQELLDDGERPNNLSAKPESGTAESARNLLLRRADWRFLLPDPRPEWVACLADGELRAAVNAVFPRVALLQPQPQDPVDLVVAVAPGANELQRIRDAMRPGGTIYTEWKGRPVVARTLIQRKLRRAGLVDVRTWCPWPNAATARVWLPLDAPGSLAYQLDRRAPARTIAKRWRKRLSTTAVRALLGIGLAPTIVAVAGVPHEIAPDEAAQKPWRGSAGPLGDVTVVGNGIRRATFPGWILLTGGPRSVSKAVGLAFAPNERLPTLAVKMDRTAEARAGLLREAAVLRVLERERPELTSIPRVKFLEDRPGPLLLVESVVAGRPLSERWSQREFKDSVQTMTDWAIELAGRPTRAQRDQWWFHLGKPVVDAFDADFGPLIEPLEREECIRAIKQLGELPIVPEHRDLAPWNIVDLDGRIGVLDWESSEFAGLPARDLIYFLTYGALLATGAANKADAIGVYRSLRDPSSELGAVADKSLKRYSSAVGLNHDALHPLHLLTWMLHACSEHRRIAEDAGGTPSVGQLRTGLFQALWRAELKRP